MNSHIRHNILIFLLLGIFALPGSGVAQKKKKPVDDSPQGIRLREAEFYFTEGEKFFILEDYAKALLYYQRSLEINADNGTVHYKIAEVLAKSNKQDDLVKASISVERALDLDKTNKYFYLLAANIYNSLARFEKAAQAYEKMIEEVKGTEEFLYELAAVYQYANKPEEAIKTYTRAESIFGINEISTLQKTRLLLEAGKTREAIAEGERLLNAFPEEEGFVMSLTELLSQKGLRNEAIQYLEKFVQKNESAGTSRMLLAGFYRDTQQEAKARPLLRQLFSDPSIDVSSKVIVISAYNAELHQAKMKGQTDPEKEKFVVELFEKLLASNPEQTNVHVVGGDLYLTIGKDREAMREYTQATAQGEVSFEVWENLLFIETKLEQWDSAITHSETALEYFPNHAIIYYYNGYSLIRKRMFREAISSLEQAKRLSVSDPRLSSEINGLIGDSYNALKDYTKSDKAYEDALALNPDNAIVLNNYSFFLSMRRENLDKAEKMSATLIKNNPDNPTFLDTHAWVLYIRQKYKDAKRIIERAISTGKANASHFEHYGDILYQLGEVDNAVKQWEKARGLNAKSETLNKKIANRKIYE
ncbi:MAG TPA: tetratricopeptide repeat protein [Chryseosolibacter sp.]